MHNNTIRKGFIKRGLVVRVYRGFGHKNRMQVFGHVLFSRKERKRKKKRLLGNMKALLDLFFVKPVFKAEVVLEWEGKQISTLTEEDGFFRLEWESTESVPAGEHKVQVRYTNGKQVLSGEGSVIVPHVTQLGIISDIDDTLLISHSSTIIKRLLTLFRHHAGSRRAFEGVADFYRKLQYTHTDKENPNPFFYVSSSEWNLYPYLQVFFDVHKFPRGVFLLNQLKRWYNLLASGQTKHSGKFVRIIRIMEAFPKQSFLLIGDNTQQDPEIYAAVAAYFPQRVKAVFIRMVLPGKKRTTEAQLKVVKELNIPYCIFRDTPEAEVFAKQHGLLSGIM